ncbi:hypothetical protein [Hartmannibacter diazotrophicus]|nr:hypothetical protein [Hartmannibacter diazotrophicus]
MSTRVRALVGSSSNTLDPLIALLQSASSLQKSAIGAGMARAAVACEGSHLEYSQQIQEAAASVDDETFLTAFQTAQDDIQTAALGGGGGLTTAGAISGGPSNGTTGGFGDTNLTPNNGASSSARSRSFTTLRSNLFVTNDVSPTSQ